MLRSKGSVLTAVLLLALAILVILGAGWLLYPWLPPPEHANREQLFRWLVTYDLAEESHGTRLALARRLEEELRAGVDWHQTRRRLDGSQQRRLRDNVLVILKPWFMDRVDGYFALEPSRRMAYLDEVLETAACCRHVSLLCDDEVNSTPGGGHSNEPGLLCELLSRIDMWKRQSGPARRAQIAQFAAAAQARWLQTRDLGEESADSRRQLAERLEERLRAGVDWQAAAWQIDPHYRQRLRENILLLAEPWFLEQVDRYWEAPPSERGRHVQRVLDVLEACRGVRLPPAQAGSKTSGEDEQDLLLAMLAEVDSWKQRVDPQRARQIDGFVQTVRTRWLLRNLRQIPLGAS